MIADQQRVCLGFVSYRAGNCGSIIGTKIVKKMF